jgi:transmembrane sensor
MNEMERQPTDAEEQARRWVVVMAGEEPSNETRKAFNHWLAEDRSHQAAYADAQNVWNALEHIPRLRAAAHSIDLSRYAVAQPIEEIERKTPPWMRTHARFITGIAATLVVAILTVMLTSSNVLNWRGTQYATAVAEIRDIRLADGSVVTLGARSQIEVRYDDSERRVKLLAGEAFFSVAKNPHRPFYVTADNTVVRVVGTQFEVHRGVEQVRVSVAEGRVEVATSNERRFFAPLTAPAQTAVLTPGQEILTSRASDAAPVRAVERVSPPAAWREGRLFYDGAALIDVVADVNRYYAGRIELASPEIGRLRITGSFRTDRIDQLLANLQQILPVVAEHDGTDTVILKLQR